MSDIKMTDEVYQAMDTLVTEVLAQQGHENDASWDEKQMELEGPENLPLRQFLQHMIEMWELID